MRVCGQPATVRVEANLNGRHSTMLLCDDHYRQLVRQQSAPSRRWKPCSARAAAYSRTSSAVTSSASATTRRRWPPIPMTWSMPRSASPPPQVRVRAPSRQWFGQPHQRTVGSPAAGGRQTRCRIWPRRGGYRTSAAGAGRQRRGQDHPGSVQDQGR